MSNDILFIWIPLACAALCVVAYSINVLRYPKSSPGSRIGDERGIKP